MPRHSPQISGRVVFRTKMVRHVTSPAADFWVRGPGVHFETHEMGSRPRRRSYGFALGGQYACWVPGRSARRQVPQRLARVHERLVPEPVPAARHVRLYALRQHTRHWAGGAPGRAAAAPGRRRGASPGPSRTQAADASRATNSIACRLFQPGGCGAGCGAARRGLSAPSARGCSGEADLGRAA